MANYTTNNGKFTFGAGVSGQYVRNNAKDISLTTTITTDGQITFGAGVSGQYARNNAKDISLTTTITTDGLTKSLTQEFKPHKESFVLSPELKATWNANKNISVEANVNAFGGGITASYTL